MRLTRTSEPWRSIGNESRGWTVRSLGQEADSVGRVRVEPRDILSPLIRNLGSMLVKGATPVEILKQYMAKGDSPTRGRELNIHFGDTDRGFIGQISPLGDMVPVMAGVTLSFKMRRQDRVGLVYVGDGATSTGAFHEGINFAAVQRCPLVVIVENNGYAYSTPTSKQTAAKQFVDKAIGYGVPGEQAGNDVLASRSPSAQSIERRGEGVSLIELMAIAERARRARQPSYAGGRDRSLGARTIRPRAHHASPRRVFNPTSEIEAADDKASRRGRGNGCRTVGAARFMDALVGVYADPPSESRSGFERESPRRRRAAA
jgi:pyruvate dehydrogenase E1 component alpha subunit/2-oxoisovalerate dehydrogenase E1 component alpha subunit